MDCNNVDTNDFKVDEGAFWHINMDLYYGYQPGEVVEVEHESDKYWLATIKYSFKHLVLLEWIGKYGEFWVDTSMHNSTTGSSITFDKSNGPKRLFPPGYHLQSQLKSQFTLAWPTNALVKPSLYNPANDPYAEIKTVEDLLSHEIDNHKDIYANPTSTSKLESTSLVLAKCKTKIDFGQDDVDELEAALQNLNEIDSDDQKVASESTPSANLETQGSIINTVDEKTIKREQIVTDINDEDLQRCSDEGSLTVDGKLLLKCRQLQRQAIATGRYCNQDKKVFYLKPKQFFDIGGANHEKVLVPGTLLEVCYDEDDGSGLKLYQWPAIVLNNVGGRLTLRWFLCDEPKFKQGRIEPKSCLSEFVIEESEETENVDNEREKRQKSPTSKKSIPISSITFCMHFCNPRIHSIGHARDIERLYKMPSKMYDSILAAVGPKQADITSATAIIHIFDSRRMNLDKDRPIIDHLLSTIRWKTPQYVNLAFAIKDTKARREVLISTPKATKLLRGFVKKELEACVYEVQSDPLYESETVKFIHPYNASYSILPPDWAVNNQDCLSVHPSRTHTPSPDSQVVEAIKDLAESVEDCSEAKISAAVEERVNCLKDQVSDEQMNSSSYESSNPILTLTSPSGRDVTLSDTQSGGVDNSIPDMVVPCVEAQKHPLCPENRKQWLQETFDLQLQCEIPRGKYEYNVNEPFKFDDQDPTCWTTLLRTRELLAQEFRCSIDYSLKDEIHSKFKVMDQLEVVHPSSDSTICLGRIRKVVYPLLWIQISPESYTLLPFNSTDIYPSGWCESNNHPLLSLLPVRKRLNPSPQQSDKKRKRIKNGQGESENENNVQKSEYEKEHFDLANLSDKQIDIDSILNQKSTFIRIYFNHKCFTGPSLSKGKICSLPQYVGPGPLRLVMEEVVTKVISVAYVPPRILNDLSSNPFEELLTARGLTNTTQMEFKAKYQKRVHREDIPVCLNPDDIALYCECVCEHLKCCYNLFGPNLYDGDDCPGHCRVLTKSNKFMKRATYYREKARLGEFLNDGSAKKNSNNSSSSRARYSGRESSESNSSGTSRSEQVNSRASAAVNEMPLNDLKENLVAVDEELDEESKLLGEELELNRDNNCASIKNPPTPEATKDEPEVDKVLVPSEHNQNANIITNVRDSPKQVKESEFVILKPDEINPENWSTTDVVTHLEMFHLGCFTPHILFENVDGQALLLLDRVAIKEHFKQHPKATYTPEEVSKLCRFVEFLKSKSEGTSIQT